MQEMLPINPVRDDDNTTFNPEDIPKEMDIFFRSEASFLPKGRTFADLTPEESELLKERYRFSPLRPGIYQGITGRQGRNGGRNGNMVPNT